MHWSYCSLVLSHRYMSSNWTMIFSDQIMACCLFARKPLTKPVLTLQWRHNGHNGVSYNQPHHCLLNRLFRLRSKKTSKLHVTDLCVRNSPVTSEFPAQMASNAENVSIWWRHHYLSWRAICILTLKQLDMHWCTISIEATAAPVPKHQAIHIHNTDKISIILNQFHTKILHLCGKLTNKNYILVKKYSVV